MRKTSKERENPNRDELENMLDARDAVAMEVMREVFERLPYGQKFKLSDGSVAHLEKLAEPDCARMRAAIILNAPILALT